MGFFLLLMLLFPGVCGLSSSVPRQFHVVKENRTWAEAQQYCRAELTDLATIDNMAEMDEVKRVMQDAGVGQEWKAWIGLKYGNSPKWLWSLADQGFYGENEAEFQNWDPGQPQGGVGEDCGCLHQEGKWHDHTCNNRNRFFCYNGTNSKHPYVLVENMKTWVEAQRYCRAEHTDLASVRNQAENDQIKNLIQNIDTTGDWALQLFWIGLFRDAWEWSDGSNSSFHHWAPYKPNYDDSPDGLCVEILSSGMWNDVSCSWLHNFVCYEALPTVEVVSPQSPFYSGDAVTMRCDITKYADHRHYVWLKDSSAVPGNTTRTITITLPGQYQCYRQRENSSVGPYISKPLDIEYQALPYTSVEVLSPQSPFYSGDKVTLKCNITQYTDWHYYEWYKGNGSSSIPGETNQTLTITLPLEQGRYACYGRRKGRPDRSDMSWPKKISYQDLPAATVDLVSPPGPHYSGYVVTLKCNVTPFEDWHQYLWLKDNSSITGETSQAINITLPEEGGQYQCYGQRNNRPMTSSLSSPVNISSNAVVKKTRQMVRVVMDKSDEVDMEDPDVQAALLQQIGQRLKAKGLAGDAQLSWKKQADGNVFHKEKKKEKRNEL